MSLPMPKQDLGRSVRLLLQTSIMALTLFAAATSFAQTKPNIAMRGYPTIGAPGVMRTTADIMMEQDLVGGLPHVQQDKPEHDLS